MKDEDKTKEQLIDELKELRFFKHVFDQLPVCTIVYDPSEKVVYRNKATKIIDGYDDKELLGLTRDEYLRRLQVSQGNSKPTRLLPSRSKDSFQNGVYGFNETTLKTKAGSIKNVLLKGDFVYDEEDKLLGVCGCCIDITEHIQNKRQAEESLRLSEERFSKAFNASPNIMSIRTLADGRYIFVNDSFLQQTGYQHHEVIGRTADDLNIYVNPEEYFKIKNYIAEQGYISNYEHKYRIKSGEVRHGLLSIEIININGKECMLSVVTDITHLKQLEKEMARLDRLNLVGEMAAGIGHEIRNPMTTVRGFLQMLNSKDEYSKHKEFFNLMIEELDRANSIISEYLSLAKNKVIEIKKHNINSIIRAIEPLIQSDALRSDKYVSVETYYVPDLLLDEKEIRQMIFNLVRNGLEAMSSGGNLSIRTYAKGNEVVLSVQDQGRGIEPHVLEQIGTPFITTKDNGTGLGLAVCYSIAARHNATIRVETGSGGTTFLVQFKLP